MYTTLLNWATGFLGKSIAIAAFILGAGIGIARSSPIPALAGVVSRCSWSMCRPSSTAS
ncbi:MAG: hypothetical protein IPH41_16550 [Sulfuritalea sp.]|nr:hypothetical protein [Sulfuritalea sp.]